MSALQFLLRLGLLARARGGVRPTFVQEVVTHNGEPVTYLGEPVTAPVPIE